MHLFKSVKGHIAFVITSVLPINRWYQSAYTISDLLAPIKAEEKYKYKNTVAMSRAGKLNGLLALITRVGKPFPIPVRAQGLDLFLKTRPNGLILCSTHMPLSKVALAYLIAQGYPPTLALAANPGVVNSIAVWGSTEKIPAVRIGPLVLQKARSVLQQGNSIVVLVDQELGGPYFPNVFRLAEKLNTDIIFFDAALQKGGLIEVTFRESVWNGCAYTNRVENQMNELYQHTTALLQHYGNASYIEAPCRQTLQVGENDFTTS